MRVLRLPYLVGIVVPSLGGLAQVKLKPADQAQAIRVVLEAFEGWFGGATPMKTPPGGIVRLEDGTPLLDSDQTLVVAGTTRLQFKKREADVVRLAEKIGKMLMQESIGVLAFATSDSMPVIPGLSKR